MKKLLLVLAAIVVLSALAGIAVAQQVNVTVNGEQVQFTGTKPMTQLGRVLVPLRGVLEKMGAFVDWVPATRTVVAQKGDLDVQLPVGSKTGTVNGKQVTLDVPAAVMAGSTMVPLRFLGEALGADVKWDAPSKTVVIATTGGTSEVTPPPAQTGITSFSHDASGWLRSGSTIKVTLAGTPGGEASFEIPGATSAIKMTESSNGRYTGSWTVPASAKITVSGGAVIGNLRADGKEKMIQAGDDVSIDTVAPKISDARPPKGSSVALAKPSITVVLDDGGGSGIDTSAVKMTVNGEDVTDQAAITGSLAAYKPAKALPSEVNVAVSVADAAGNTATATWKFAIRTASDVITAFTHSDISNLQPGDVLTVELTGEANGTANFAIIQEGQTLRSIPMQATSAGVYKGEYTIRRDDRLAGAKIVGTLKTAAGETFTTEAEGAIGGTTTSALKPPVIAQPAAGVAAKSPLTVKGTAAPDSRVSLKLSYVTTVLGFRMSGALGEQMVEVDSKGNFASQPMNLGTMVKGKNTEYTLTATQVDASGEESEAVTVTFTGS